MQSSQSAKKGYEISEGNSGYLLMDGSDLDFETRVGKPWTRRIQREQFEVFLSKCPGRNGDEAREKARGE
jgi:hypothetical protein